MVIVRITRVSMWVMGLYLYLPSLLMNQAICCFRGSDFGRLRGFTYYRVVMRYVIGMQDPRIKAPCYGFLGPTRIYTYEYIYIYIYTYAHHIS